MLSAMAHSEMIKPSQNTDQS